MAVVLVLTAIGLRGLTQPARSPEPSRPTTVESEAQGAEILETDFFLTLSAPASEVLIESGDQSIRLTNTTQHESGKINLPHGHPAIFITIKWTEEDEAPRFAKLRLEPKGLATQEKTFDSSGELSDVWEPHLH